MAGSLKDNNKQFNYPKGYYYNAALDNSISDLKNADDSATIGQYRSQINLIISAIKEEGNNG